MTFIKRAESGAIHPSRWNKFARMPTQRHCWVRASLETINARDQEYLVTFGNAVAPFQIRRRMPHRLAFIGDPMGEPYDVLSDGDTIDGLAVSIVRTGRLLNLMRVPADAPIIGALQRAYRGRGSVVINARRRGCPYIELDETWLEPERHFSGSWRSSFSRMRRKAENHGEVTFQIIAPKPTEVRALLDEVIAVEAASWMKPAGIAMAVNQSRRRFYGRFAEYAAQEGILRFCFLRINGKPVAMEYAVECSGRFFAHKIAFDEAFKSCSPGNLLRLETIRYAAERGLKSYEFQGKDAGWTYFWTKTVRPMVWLEAYPLTVRGLWMRSSDTVQARARRVGKWAARFKGALGKTIDLVASKQARSMLPKR